jgi:ribonucleotide reductase alpha subunit
MTNTNKAHMSTFANTIFRQKYAQEGEEWHDTAMRVSKHVLKSVRAAKSLIDQTAQYITERKFIPGGRYLYAAGRQLHQVNNCLLARAEDSREGWAEHMHNHAMGLMTGAGIGTDYSNIRPEGKLIRKTGGFATGPLALMTATNELGRSVMQGGSRRSALWAGLSWSHPDIMKFITMKNWIQEVRDLKSRDFNFPATMDMTNISVQLDDEFFEAYADDKHARHSQAQMVYWATVERMLKTGEPGFSIDTGTNAKETLRNAPVTGQTRIVTPKGEKPVSSIVGIPTTVWTGRQWAHDVVFSQTGVNVPVVKVTMTNGRKLICDPTHPFFVKKLDFNVEAFVHVSLRKVPAELLVERNILHVSLPDTYESTLVRVVSVEPAGNADVFCADVKVPEHSFMAEGVIISNCTELTSADDSDICNLGSINLARIADLEEMKAVTECATAFLLAGTVYSDVPYPKVDQVRTKNRRIGLGLMGIHEWLLVRGKKYGTDEELDKYLAVYATSTKVAHQYSDKWDLSKSVKTRAVAPTGTIGILAETSTGIEPIFCAAYKRRYLKGGTWNFQYVLDPTAKRIVEEGGIDPQSIEDAYVLAEDVERRLAFQAHVQKYVDHGISSTINLPQWGSELNNETTSQKFGKTLIKYLPQLRGLTTYPDGARNGQPITTVKWSTATKHIGEVFVEASDICDIRGGGTCGS